MLLLALSIASPSSAQVRDARPASASTAIAAPTGTAAITGVVMSADASPRPLRLATVVLIGATTGVLKVTSTDRDGKFAFESLPADRYTVGASKPPYLGAVSGARRPARPGTPIVLANGQKVTDAVIRLPPAAAISGTVVDEFGQPASAFVGAQRRTMQNGQLVLVDAGVLTATDERGAYRMSGLPPGEYIVSALRSGFFSASPRLLSEAEVNDALGGSPAAVPPGSPVRFAPVYYPGSPRLSEASPVVVAVGDEKGGIDIRAEATTSARVEGTLTQADGQVPVNANATLGTVHGSSYMQFSTMARVGPDGRFAIPNIPPGSYILYGMTIGPQAREFAMLPLEVNGDVAGIQLVLRPPMTLTGRVVLDGTATTPQLTGITIPFKPLVTSLSGGAQPAVTATTAQGTFDVLHLLPGRYVFGGAMSFGPNTNSVTWSLQSVVADGKDITDRPIDITPETLPKDVVVTFSDTWQSVSGRLQQASGAPATDYTVVIFPSDKSYWLTGSRRILTARPDTNGQFTLAGPGLISLPPGDYMLAAVTDIDRDEQYDPTFLATLVSAAIPLSIQPGEKKIQDLVIR
jgi:hypothetical protein